MGKSSNKGRRKGKRGGDSSSEEDTEIRDQTTTKSPDLKSLSFAERRTLQKQQAAEKRRQKLKCYFCGQAGHVRRECPGILDDGAGESKYTGKRQSKTKKSKPKTVSLPELPPGFSTSNQDDQVVFVDACCNLTETFRYLVSAHICTAAQATKRYQAILDEARQKVRLGGRLSRSLLRPGVPWKAPVEAMDDDVLWYIIGLHRDFFLHDEHTEDAVLKLQAAVQDSEAVVGVFADLDYEKVEIPGYDRESQLRRLRLIVQVAASIGVSWQMQSPRLQDASYESAMTDLKTIVQETVASYPTLRIHVCGWSGSASDMLFFLQLSPRLFIGLDGSVTFQKATHLHECAFDIPLDRLVLETGRTSSVPSCWSHSRDSFCHSGMIPWIAQAIAQQKKMEEDNGAALIAQTATTNALSLYPALADALQARIKSYEEVSE